MSVRACPARVSLRCSPNAVGARPRGRGVVRGALVLSSLLSAAVLAQGSSADKVVSPSPAPPLAGERLSDWLLRGPAQTEVYSPGISWTVPSQRAAQESLKRELLGQVARSDRVDKAAAAAVAAAIEALPVTGRLPVPVTDPRWLQAHPKADPVLQSDHRVLVPRRPVSVSFLRGNGTWCSVPHQPGHYARDYLRTCEPPDFEKIDWAWLIQPDGVIQRVGIASWNRHTQDEIAPGGLVWAPKRDSGWSPEVSALLARFLATQSYDEVLRVAGQATGPASSSPQAVVPEPRSGRPARDGAISSSSWGMAGLIQTPSARFAEAGEARFHFSRSYPNDRFNVFLQPFDWIEAGFRYTDVRNRLYGEADRRGIQSYKDKSIDLRVRLLEESAYVPQIALGMIDLGGTGLFSSEFVVANKRVGDFDWSLGMGWGNLGASGNVRNPFSMISSRFDVRGGGSAQGGTANTSTFFRGPAALFGGVQYHTPWDKWLLKAEYDGNNYQSEPLGNNLRQRTPVNLGVVYRHHPSLEMSMGMVRGDAIMLGLTLRTSVAKLQTPKVSDPPAPAVTRARPDEDPVWVSTAVDVFGVSGWTVHSISRTRSSVRVVFEGATGAHWNDRIGRVTSVLHRDSPASIDTFELVFVEQGIVLSERVIDRDVWSRQQTAYEAETLDLVAVVPRAPQSDQTLSEPPLWERETPRFGYGFVPSWQQNIGGPDGFLLFRAGLAVPMQFRINRNTSISGAISFNLLDNFENFKYTGPSNLPRVRTYLREYMTESRVNVPNIQITHFGQLAQSQYFSVYGGYLESMYGGVGAEWLYRPWHSPLAFGIDINSVRQRNFDQLFGFDRAGAQTGYRVSTGHATAYWDTGWKSTFLKLSAGQYLAGDKGVTVDIGRTFSNGVSIGAWATRTNVSAERFGEGSFDKGMYLRIPFDVMTTTRGGDTANLVYSPLTRDGGARLNRNFTLYGATTARSKTDTGFAPAVDNERR